MVAEGRREFACRASGSCLWMAEGGNPEENAVYEIGGRGPKRTEEDVGFGDRGDGNRDEACEYGV